MTVSIDVPALYRATYNVWVEDAVAAAYLRELWADQAIQFQFLVAGGKSGVSSLAHQAQECRWPGIFGIVDRDFDESNHAKWMAPTKQFRRFVIPRFELENYFLDPDLLASTDLNNNRKSSMEIRDRVANRATGLVWWMACRHTIAVMRHAALDGFPKHPANSAIIDLPSARKFVEDSSWFADIQQRIKDATALLEDNLNASHAKYQGSLTSGDNPWGEFSGKELFRDAASFFYSSSGASRDVDLAKSIARAQRESNSIPQDFQDLQRAILNRKSQNENVS